MGEVLDEYGRMKVMLGLELPQTTPGAQNFMIYGYASPPVEIIKGMYATQIGANEDGTQIWKITHTAWIPTSDGLARYDHVPLPYRVA